MTFPGSTGEPRQAFVWTGRFPTSSEFTERLEGRTRDLAKALQYSRCAFKVEEPRLGYTPSQVLDRLATFAESTSATAVVVVILSSYIERLGGRLRLHVRWTNRQSPISTTIDLEELLLVLLETRISRCLSILDLRADCDETAFAAVRLIDELLRRDDRPGALFARCEPLGDGMSDDLDRMLLDMMIKRLSRVAEERSKSSRLTANALWNELIAASGCQPGHQFSRFDASVDFDVAGPIQLWVPDELEWPDGNRLVLMPLAIPGVTRWAIAVAHTTVTCAQLARFGTAVTETGASALVDASTAKTYGVAVDELLEGHGYTTLIPSGFEACLREALSVLLAVGRHFDPLDCVPAEEEWHLDDLHPRFGDKPEATRTAALRPLRVAALVRIEHVPVPTQLFLRSYAPHIGFSDQVASAMQYDGFSPLIGGESVAGQARAAP